MFELKPLHHEAIPAALEKANRYRLLNEPGAAESIYLDILAIDPDNQEALVNIVLAGLAILTVVAQGQLARIAALACGILLVAAFLAWLSRGKK